MNKTIDIAAKQYADKWNVDNGTKKLIIEAYKQGAKYIINNNIKK